MEAFDRAGALDKLEEFASFNGPVFYGFPRNAEMAALEREALTISAALPVADATVVTSNVGESIGWKMV